MDNDLFDGFVGHVCTYTVGNDYHDFTGIIRGHDSNLFYIDHEVSYLKIEFTSGNTRDVWEYKGRTVRNKDDVIMMRIIKETTEDHLRRCEMGGMNRSRD